MELDSQQRVYDDTLQRLRATHRAEVNELNSMVRDLLAELVQMAEIEVRNIRLMRAPAVQPPPQQ